jgi:S1-C subfamily serine protease
LIGGSLRGTVQRVVALFLLVAVVVFARYLAVSNHELRHEIHNLTYEVRQLGQEQDMPAQVLSRYRNFICYIFGIYQLGLSAHGPAVRARFSGTGFVVADGLVATNRHVAEPWYKDPDDTALIRQGATPHVVKLLAFFPGLPEGVRLTPLAVSAQGDLAVLHIEDPDTVRQLRPLPLSASTPQPGELVSVVGYPMGVFGMVAKAPEAIYESLALRHDDQIAAQLAALSLIRPSATFGHLGDVVGDKLIYDAPTAPGASGGPVFNSRGEVIGINTEYVKGFAGGTLGMSVRTLLPLIAVAGRR